MSKPRKKYREKPVHLNALQRAIESASKLQAADVANLKSICAAALSNYRRGEDCRSNWRNLADALNIAEALAELGICSDQDSRDSIAAGHAALSAVMLRQQMQRSWALRAAEMQALDDAIWRHGIQLDHCSLREYKLASERVRARTVAALAGNAAPGVEVLCA